MKRFALLLIMLCASGIVSMAQDYSYEANPKKFDLSIGVQNSEHHHPVSRQKIQ